MFRAGGYFWDGNAWYRPAQVWDGAGEKYYRRAVPAAVTVTTKDWLQGGNPARARLLSITEVDVDAAPPALWRDDLALWASHHNGDLADSVVTLAAPELTGDQLVGVAEMAEIASIGASTLRAYIARGESDVPLPQSTINGRSMWARPVAEDWAEQRQRSREGQIKAVSANRDTGTLPTGLSDLWTRFTKIFFSALWDQPNRRKRWALRWRNEAAVRDVAEDLSWDLVANVRQIVPVYDVATIVSKALLHDFAHGKDLHRDRDRDYQFFGVLPPVARTLDWLIRHEPAAAGRVIAETIGEAERELDVPRQVSERSITTALTLDGTLDKETREDFLKRVLAPENHNA